MSTSLLQMTNKDKGNSRSGQYYCYNPVHPHRTHIKVNRPEDVPIEYTGYACVNTNCDELSSFPNHMTELTIEHTNIEYMHNLPPTLTELHAYSSLLQSLDCIRHLNVTYIDCSRTNVSDCSKLPHSLTHLICSNDDYDVVLDDLPPALTYLSCSGSNIRALNNLPKSLTYLDCSGSNIRALNNLPKSLTYLDCGINYITSLDNLPHNLTYLDCSNNTIAKLNNLPPHLKDLSCSSNRLTELTDIPAFLTSLKCSFNTLQILPKLPNTLTHLECVSCELSHLDNLPTSITHLDYSRNNITSLECPPQLTYLGCRNIKFAQPMALPPKLQTLDCSADLIVDHPPHTLRDISSACTITNLPPFMSCYMRKNVGFHEKQQNTTAGHIVSVKSKIRTLIKAMPYHISHKLFVMSIAKN